MDQVDQIFIVGDIHGCFKEWMLLLEKAGYQKNHHRMILVGDLINKGPDSFQVLKWAYDNKIETIIGNHEYKFIQSIEQNLTLSTCFQDLKTKMGSKLEMWIQYIKSFPSFIEEEDFIVVHGGIVPEEHPRDSKLENIINMRYWNTKEKKISPSGQPWYEYYKEEKLVIYGHWAKQGLLKRKHSIGLDTGCVYGRELSGVWLPSQTIVQIPSMTTSNPTFYK